MSSIEKRLAALEQRTLAPTAQGQYTAWTMGVVGAVYESVTAAETARRVASLGPQPEPTTEAERVFQQRLQTIYGGNQ